MMPQIIGLFPAAPYPGIPAPLFELDTSERAQKLGGALWQYLVHVYMVQKRRIFWVWRSASLMYSIDINITYKDTFLP